MPCSFKSLEGSCSACKCINPQFDIRMRCSCGHNSHLHRAFDEQCQCQNYSSSSKQDTCKCGHMDVYHTSQPSIQSNYQTSSKRQIHNISNESINSSPIETPSSNNNKRNAARRPDSSNKKSKPQSQFATTSSDRYMKSLSNTAHQETIVDTDSESESNKNEVDFVRFRHVTSYFHSFLNIPKSVDTKDGLRKYSSDILDSRNIIQWLKEGEASSTTKRGYISRLTSFISFIGLDPLSKASYDEIVDSLSSNNDRQTPKSRITKSDSDSDSDIQSYTKPTRTVSQKLNIANSVAVYLSGFANIPPETTTKKEYKEYMDEIKNLDNMKAWLQCKNLSSTKKCIQELGKFFKDIGEAFFDDTDLENLYKGKDVEQAVGGNVDTIDVTLGKSGYLFYKKYLYNHLDIPDSCNTIELLQPYVGRIRSMENIMKWFKGKQQVKKQTLREYVTYLHRLMIGLGADPFSETELKILFNNENYDSKTDPLQRTADEFQSQKKKLQITNNAHVDGDSMSDDEPVVIQVNRTVSTPKVKLSFTIQSYLSYLKIPKENMSIPQLMAFKKLIRSTKALSSWLITIDANKTKVESHLAEINGLFTKMNLEQLNDNDLSEVISMVLQSVELSSDLESASEEERLSAIHSSDMHSYLRYLKIPTIQWSDQGIKQNLDTVKSIPRVIEYLNTSFKTFNAREIAIGHLQHMLISFDEDAFESTDIDYILYMISQSKAYTPLIGYRSPSPVKVFRGSSSINEDGEDDHVQIIESKTVDEVADLDEFIHDRDAVDLDESAENGLNFIQDPTSKDDSGSFEIQDKLEQLKAIVETSKGVSNNANDDSLNVDDLNNIESDDELYAVSENRVSKELSGMDMNVGDNGDENEFYGFNEENTGGLNGSANDSIENMDVIGEDVILEEGTTVSFENCDIVD